MELLPWILTGVFAAGMLLLCMQNWLLKKDMMALMEQLETKLHSDTNISLYVSGKNACIRQIAEKLDQQLDLLRKQQLKYQHGNLELKTAVTNISHDLRTPLTTICGYLDVMKHMEKPQKIGEYLEIIDERAGLMQQLTEELFQYSVILSEDHAAETEDVFVNQVLTESISGYYAVLTAHAITPQIHITSKKIFRRLNAVSLSRVFSNLLNNAVKYSDGDLEITLTDAGEIIFANTAGELSSVQVERLFDRFYTVETAKHSTGLGLSIARTLVEQMGGTITAEYHGNRLKIKMML